MENISYYIHHGEKAMMYTLRCQYVESTSYGKQWRDQYCCNLSIDKDNAIKKAKARLFETEYKLIESDLPALAEIRRRSNEECEKFREQAVVRYEEEQEARRTRQRELIDKKLWPFGKFVNKEFDSADKNYILYLMNKEMDSEDKGKILSLVQVALKEHFPVLASLPKPNKEYCGKEGERKMFECTLVEAFSCANPFASSHYHTSPYIYIRKFVDSSGALLLYKGSTTLCVGSQSISSEQIGERYTFKARVKEHIVYNARPQTVIQRLTAIKTA